MSLVERCIHQGIDTGRHALFKEKWERCKNCEYDLENNKKCPDYVPTSYCVYGKEINLVSSVSLPSENMDNVRA